MSLKLDHKSATKTGIKMVLNFLTEAQAQDCVCKVDSVLIVN